jgi:hypothetical protein
MADVVDALREKLLASERVRVQLLESMKQLLRTAGMPTDDGTLKQLGFKELDVKKPREFVDGTNVALTRPPPPPD